MLKYKKKSVEVLDDVICDVCGNSTKVDKKVDVCEFAELKAEWGYWSDGRDGESHKIHFCQKCYEKMLTLMKIDIKKIAKSSFGALLEAISDAGYGIETGAEYKKRQMGVKNK